MHKWWLAAFTLVLAYICTSSRELPVARSFSFAHFYLLAGPLLVYFFFHFFFLPSRTCVPLRYEAAETREPEASVSLPRFRGNSFPLATHFHAFHSFVSLSSSLLLLRLLFLLLFLGLGLGLGLGFGLFSSTSRCAISSPTSQRREMPFRHFSTRSSESMITRYRIRAELVLGNVAVLNIVPPETLAEGVGKSLKSRNSGGTLRLVSRRTG